MGVCTFWMTATMGALSLLTSLLFEPSPATVTWTHKTISTIAVLSIMCTTVATLVMNLGLAHVPATTGSLLLTLESPFGVLFSVVLMGEQLTLRLLLGFVVIFIAIVMSETHFSFLRGRRVQS